MQLPWALLCLAATVAGQLGDVQVPSGGHLPDLSDHERNVDPLAADPTPRPVFSLDRPDLFKGLPTPRPVFTVNEPDGGHLPDLSERDRQGGAATPTPRPSLLSLDRPLPIPTEFPTPRPVYRWRPPTPRPTGPESADRIGPGRPDDEDFFDGLNGPSRRPTPRPTPRPLLSVAWPTRRPTPRPFGDVQEPEGGHLPDLSDRDRQGRITPKPTFFRPSHWTPAPTPALVIGPGKPDDDGLLGGLFDKDAKGPPEPGAKPAPGAKPSPPKAAFGSPEAGAAPETEPAPNSDGAARPAPPITVSSMILLPLLLC